MFFFITQTSMSVQIKAMDATKCATIQLGAIPVFATRATHWMLTTGLAVVSVFKRLSFMKHCRTFELDQNECLNGNNNCTHVCINTNGSYICSCNSGYVLGSDNNTCYGEQLS